MKFPRGAKIFTGQFDPLPYVGVFLCLFIFLIFFRDMVLPSGVVIDLPEIENATPVPVSPWRVVIDREGKYFFEDGLWKPEQLKSVLKERLSQLASDDEDLVVMLQADKMLPYQTLNDAMALFKEVGFKKVIQVGYSNPDQVKQVFDESGTNETE